MTRTPLQRPDAPSVVAPRAADVFTITARDDDDEVIAWRIGVVGVDLARAEPADAGTAVDLSQPDSMSCDAARSLAAGHSPARLSGARHLLSPSWPSAIRLTNAFGTGDVIDAGEEPRP